MIFTEYITYIGGLIGLWNGLSIKDIKQIAFKIIHIILNNSYLIFIFNNITVFNKRDVSRYLLYKLEKFWKKLKVS
jgi:hypothetical protein